MLGVAEVINFHPNNSTQVKLTIPVNDATVSLTVTDINGVELGTGWPVTLNYIDGSDGMYRLTLEPLNNQELGKIYSFKFDVAYDDLFSQCEIDVRSKDNVS